MLFMQHPDPLKEFLRSQLLKMRDSLLQEMNGLILERAEIMAVHEQGEKMLADEEPQPSPEDLAEAHRVLDEMLKLCKGLDESMERKRLLLADLEETLMIGPLAGCPDGLHQGRRRAHRLIVPAIRDAELSFGPGPIGWQA